MAKGFKHGGGGNPLNFSVAGNPQPENPKENTIWLNTDVPIGALYFTVTEPEGLAEGDVWFLTGTSSPVAFNALKKNGIQVYPLSAKQYVDGALVDKEAKSYQGGAWVDWWNGELYDSGNEYEAVTGGIGVVHCVAGSYLSPTSGGDKYDSYIKLRCHRGGTSGNHAFTCLSTKQPIDTAGYTVVEVDIQNASLSNGDCALQICDAYPTVKTSGGDQYIHYGNVIASVAVTKTGITQLPLNDESEVYVCVRLRTNNNAGDSSVEVARLTLV